MGIWVKQQVLLAIDTKTKFRECLRVRAYVDYISRRPAFREED